MLISETGMIMLGYWLVFENTAQVESTSGCEPSTALWACLFDAHTSGNDLGHRHVAQLRIRLQEVHLSAGSRTRTEKTTFDFKSEHLKKSGVF